GHTLTATLIGRPAHDPAFALNAGGTFTYAPVTGFQGTDSFTYVANDGAGPDSNIASVTIVTTGSTLDSDHDGIPDAVEALGPNSGDANSDGVLDYTQANVAAVFVPASTNLPQGYWTLVSSAGTLNQVSIRDRDASSPPLPPGVAVPLLIGFQVNGLA